MAARQKTIFCALLAVFCGSFLFTGCQSSRGHLRAGEAEVISVPNPGKAATLNTVAQKGGLRIPKNSRIVRTAVEAQSAKAATDSSPAEAAQPAKTVTEIVVSEPTEWTETRQEVNADSGTIDTSVAKHAIDVKSRQWLLFVAVGCGIAGLLVKSLLPEWPALSHGLLLAAPIAFASWKLAEIPQWLWMIAIGIVGLLALGYKRAEWDKNKNGIPDILEK